MRRCLFLYTNLVFNQDSSPLALPQIAACVNELILFSRNSVVVHNFIADNCQIAAVLTSAKFQPFPCTIHPAIWRMKYTRIGGLPMRQEHPPAAHAMDRLWYRRGPLCSRKMRSPMSKLLADLIKIFGGYYFDK
jgi:hypothetical protein